jgi:spore maturation protein CgeB
VLFGYFLKQLVYPEAIRDISDMGILTMNYWCNGAHQFHLVDEISPAFDVCIATERAALPDYEAVGANVTYLQMAANPARYRPYDLPLEYDVTFVGQRYADRPELVLHLLDQGIPVRVWGPGWTSDRTYGEKNIGLALAPRFVLRHPRAAVLRTMAHVRKRVSARQTISTSAERRLARIAGPSLPYEELIRMYSRSRISLGFSTTGDARYHDPVKVRQIHLRDFEATMSGAARSCAIAPARSSPRRRASTWTVRSGRSSSVAPDTREPAGTTRGHGVSTNSSHTSPRSRSTTRRGRER